VRQAEAGQLFHIARVPNASAQRNPFRDPGYVHSGVGLPVAQSATCIAGWFRFYAILGTLISVLRLAVRAK